MKSCMKTMLLLAMGMVCIIGTGTVSAETVNTKDQFSSTVIDVPAKRPEIKAIQNVVYSQVPTAGYDNMALRMDVLQPITNKKKPAVLFIPGGGFIHANKDKLRQARMALAEAGYVVAAMEYRVAPTATFPQPLEDVKSAVRYLRAHADKFGIDSNHIGLFGNSAGGYLAGIAGTTNGNKKFDVGDNLEQSSEVQAVCDWYGVTDLRKIGVDYSPAVQKLHESAGATEALWLKGSPVFGGKDGGVQAYPQEAEAANPLHYIDNKTPPFLLMHGDADVVVSPSATDDFYQALRQHSIPAQRYVIRKAGHGGVYWAQPQVLQILVQFFDTYLK